MLGKIIRDIAPDKMNKRNSEGAFVKLKNGDLLYGYTRYGADGVGDDNKADLYGILSSDSGESFGEPFLLFSAETVGADNIMSVSFLRLKNGDLGLIYLQKRNKIHSCVPYLAISRDEGKSWTKHIRCIEDDGYYVLNNDRIIRLTNGRILLPVALHGYEKHLGPGEIMIYASDDDGITWYNISGTIKLDAPVRRKEADDLRSCMEPGLVQLEHGTVWCFIRTALGRQYETFSDDFGKTWSKIQPSPFTSPASPMSVKKLKNGSLCAVWNPIPEYNGRNEFSGSVWLGGRSPFVIAVLDRDGDYPQEYKVFEDDDKRGFCYCAIYETENGDILLGYCAGGEQDGSCLSKTRIRKIYRKELGNNKA